MDKPDLRRILLTGMAMLPALGLVPPGLTQSRDRLERFRHLSARLTGFPVEALDRSLARSLLQSLLAVGEGPALEQWLTSAQPNPALARRIIVAWYSGIHPIPQPPAPTASAQQGTPTVQQGTPTESIAQQGTPTAQQGTPTESTALRTYQDALVWQALHFTKPPGLCSSRPNDWALPPAVAAEA